MGRIALETTSLSRKTRTAYEYMMKAPIPLRFIKDSPERLLEKGSREPKKHLGPQEVIQALNDITILLLQETKLRTECSCRRRRGHRRRHRNQMWRTSKFREASQYCLPNSREAIGPQPASLTRRS